MLRRQMRLNCATSVLIIQLLDCREHLDKELHQLYPEAFNAYFDLKADPPLHAPTDSTEQPKQ